MKYLKKYLESNSIEINEEDLQFISDLFKIVENELMLERSFADKLEKNQYKINITKNGEMQKSIFIFSKIENNEIIISEVEKIWKDFIKMIRSYGYDIANTKDTDVIPISNNIYFGASIIYR